MRQLPVVGHVRLEEPSKTEEVSGVTVWTILIVLAMSLLALLVSGLAIFNIVAVLGLFVLWLVVPAWGAWLFTAWWVALIGSRLMQVRKWGRERLYQAFTMSFLEQNRTAALLIIVGIGGAVRSYLAGETLSVGLGVLGALACFMTQGPLFRPPTVTS